MFHLLDTKFLKFQKKKRSQLKAYNKELLTNPAATMAKKDMFIASKEYSRQMLMIRHDNLESARKVRP